MSFICSAIVVQTIKTKQEFLILHIEYCSNRRDAFQDLQRHKRARPFLEIRGLDVGRAGNNIRDALLQRICISMPKCFHQIILSGRKFLIGRWSKFTKTITPTKHLSFEFIVNQSSNWIESVKNVATMSHR